jgi:hypothetical protein
VLWDTSGWTAASDCVTRAVKHIFLLIYIYIRCTLQYITGYRLLLLNHFNPPHPHPDRNRTTVVISVYVLPERLRSSSLHKLWRAIPSRSHYYPPRPFDLSPAVQLALQLLLPIFTKQHHRRLLLRKT